ncbi:MAG: HNH endonuclease [Gemmatimonadales bacterium]
MKQLAELTSTQRVATAPAYYNQQWRRDLAPLLDELACSIDHREAFVSGGAHGIENFEAVCARCNARKGTRSEQEHLAAAAPWKVKGKHGEPTAWDGLSGVFIALAEKSQRKLTTTEVTWLRALKDHSTTMASPADRSIG